MRSKGTLVLRARAGDRIAAARISGTNCVSAALHEDFRNAWSVVYSSLTLHIMGKKGHYEQLAHYLDL